jgi:hypothetical protein
MSPEGTQLAVDEYRGAVKRTSIKQIHFFYPLMSPEGTQLAVDECRGAVKRSLRVSITSTSSTPLPHELMSPEGTQQAVASMSTAVPLSVP